MIARLLSTLLATAFTVSAADVLTLKNGRTADCRILSLSPAAVKILWQEKEEREIPLTDIDFITFAPLPGEAAALTQAVSTGTSEPLMEFWVKKIPRLPYPRSDAGETGLTYAELLSRNPTPDRIQRALTVYTQIESADWSTERRSRAQAGRLRLLLRQGRIAEVLQEAEKLLRQQLAPRVMIEVQHVLAETAAARLDALLKDHPRWEQEDDVRPRRDRLYHEVLDAFLYPHVFHGAEQDLAARGLWAAAQFYARHGDPAAARAAAADLTALYPETPEATAAAAFAAKLPASSATAAEPDAATAPDPGP